MWYGKIMGSVLEMGVLWNFPLFHHVKCWCSEATRGGPPYTTIWDDLGWGPSEGLEIADRRVDCGVGIISEGTGSHQHV